MSISIDLTDLSNRFQEFSFWPMINLGVWQGKMAQDYEYHKLDLNIVSATGEQLSQWEEC